MATILIVYFSTDGHTLKICRRLQQVIERDGHSVTLMSLNNGPARDPEPFDKIVIGASIRYGKHSRKVHDFIEKNRQILDSKANAFFSVNVVARKPEKSQPETNPYLQKFLKKITWKPKLLAVFGGKIDYRKYRFWDRLMIRAIMWMTDGPTHPQTVAEFTDWAAVEAFGKRIAAI